MKRPYAASGHVRLRRTAPLAGRPAAPAWRPWRPPAWRAVRGACGPLLMAPPLRGHFSGKARLYPFLPKWPFKFARECARTAFSRRGGIILPPVLRRAPCRSNIRKRPLPAAGPPLPDGKAGPAALGRSSRSGGRPDSRFAQARPASLNDKVTAPRVRQPSLTTWVSAELPAVRPTVRLRRTPARHRRTARANDCGLARNKEREQLIRSQAHFFCGPEAAIRRGIRLLADRATRAVYS